MQPPEKSHNWWECMGKTKHKQREKDGYLKANLYNSLKTSKYTYESIEPYKLNFYPENN